MKERFSKPPSTKGGYLKKATESSKASGPSAKSIAADKAALLAKHTAEKAKFEDKHGAQDWGN
jgi:hypothetical protein